MTIIAVERRNQNISNRSRSTRFVQNWLAAADASRSLRRRLSAILRMSCRSLGMKRGRGLGMLGIGGTVAGVVIVTAMVVTLPVQALAGGFFVNDGPDGDCTAISNGPLITKATGDNCNFTDRYTQTNRVHFFGYGGGAGADSLSLGGFLFVNKGWIGLNDVANGTNAMSIGDAVTWASAKDSIAIGNRAKANGKGSIALGAGSVANGAGLGNAAYLVGGTSVSELNIGSRRITDVAAGSLGTDAANISQLTKVKTDTDSAITTINNTLTTINAGKANLVQQADPNANLTVGKDTGGAAVDMAGKDAAGKPTTRKIVNVTDGNVAAGSKEGLTGGQLFTTNTALDNLGARVKNLGTSTATTFGGGAGYDPVSGAWTAPTYNITNIDANGTALSTAYNNVGSALKGLDTSVTNVNTRVGGIDTRVGAINTQITGLLSDSLQWNAGKIAYSAAHGTSTSNKITDVAPGTLSATSTDAVNGEQLFATNTAVGSLGTRVTTNTTNITAMGGQLSTFMSTFNLIAGDTSDTYVGNNGRGIRYVRTNEKNLKQGDSHAQGKGSTAVGYEATATAENSLAIGSGSSASGTQANVAIGANAKADGTTMSNRAYLLQYVYGTPQGAEMNIGDRRITGVAAGAVDTDAATIGQLKAARDDMVGYRVMTYATTTANNVRDVVKTVIDLKGDGGTLIRNVEDGEISSSSKDAVNGSQVYGVRQTINNLTSGMIGLVRQEKPGINAKLTVGKDTDGLAVDFAGKDKDGKVTTRKLLSLTAGDLNATSTDGVTGSQLFATNQAVTKNTGDISTINNNISTITNNLGTGVFGLVQQEKPGINANLTVGKDTDGLAVDFAGKDKDGKATTRKLLSLTAGDLSATSTDGVNGSQLFATNQAVTKNTGDISTINNNINNMTLGTIGLVQQADPNAKLTIGKDTGGLEVDLAGQKGPRKLIGLAAGALSATSTEGVNGSQLFDVSTNISKYLGGGADILTGVAPAYKIARIDEHGEVAPEPTSYDNVGEALGGVNSNINNVNTHVGEINTKVGDITTQIGGLTDDALLWSADRGGVYSAKHAGKGPNIVADVKAGTLDTDAVNVSQLKATNDSVTTINTTIGALNDRAVSYDGKTGDLKDVITLNRDKLSSDGGKSGGTLITNLHQGAVNATSTDGVNGSQLFATNQAVINNTTNITKNTTDISTINNNLSNITSGTVGLVRQEKPDVNANLTVGKDTDGAAVDFAGKGLQTTRQLINVAAGTRSTDAVNFGQLKLTNDSVTTINTTIGEISTQIGGLSKDALLWSAERDGIFSARHGGAGPNIIADVKAGTEDTDAVNVSQLKALQTSGGDAVKALRDRAVQYVWNDTNGNGTLDTGEIDYRKVALNGGVDADGKPVGTGISNLANGAVTSTSLEAINGSQLFDVSKNVSTYLGGKTDILNGVAPTYNIASFEGKEPVQNVYHNVEEALVGLNLNDDSFNNRITDLAEQIGGGATDALIWDENKKAFTATHAGDPLLRAVSGPNKITDLAAGEISANSTDAVNGSQLNDTNNRVATVETSSKNLGNRAVKYDWTDINGDGIVDTAEVNFNKATLEGGPNGTVLGNLGNGAVTQNSLEAINGSQIFNIARSFGGGAMFDLNGVFVGPSYTINNVNRTYEVTTNTYDNVGDALQGLGESVTNVNTRVGDINTQVTTLNNDSLRWDAGKGAFSGSHGAAVLNKITNVAPGLIAKDSTDVVTGSQLNDTNVQVTAIDNRVTTVEGNVKTIQTNINNIDGRVTILESGVTQGAVKYDTNTDGSVNKASITLGGTASTDGGVSNGTKISNLQQGAVNATSTDAVNGAQLDATNKKVDGLDGSAVKYTVTDGKKTNEVVLEGGDPSAPVLISNVATGAADNDAVNVKQLKDKVNEVTTTVNNKYNEYLDQSKTYTNTVASNTLNESKEYTDQKFNQLSSDIGSVRNEARQAAAIGLAASSLRFDGAPGKLSVAMGGGVWRDQGAVAFGAGYTSESGAVRANLTGVASGGQVGVGAGVSFTLN